MKQLRTINGHRVLLAPEAAAIHAIVATSAQALAEYFACARAWRCGQQDAVVSFDDYDLACVHWYHKRAAEVFAESKATTLKDVA